MDLYERTDNQGNVWYWVQGENDTAHFFPLPDSPKHFVTEKAVFHKEFNKLLWSNIHH